jgi:hypothetical protein
MLLSLFLILEQIPIYGIIKGHDDPFLMQIRSYAYGSHGMVS